MKATVEALDPVPRWTDRVPTPFLGFAMWNFLGALVLALRPTDKGVTFGPLVLQGWSGRVVMLALAVFMVLIAFGALRRYEAAWWAVIGLPIFGLMSVRRFELFEWTSAISGVTWLAYLAFLLYIRRYFSERPAVEPTVDLQ